MANILITPAKANKPEELQDGVGHRAVRRDRGDRGTGTYTAGRQRELLGRAQGDHASGRSGSFPRSPAAS